MPKVWNGIEDNWKKNYLDFVTIQSVNVIEIWKNVSNKKLPALNFDNSFDCGLRDTVKTTSIRNQIDFNYVHAFT